MQIWASKKINTCKAPLGEFLVALARHLMKTIFKKTFRLSMYIYKQTNFNIDIFDPTYETLHLSILTYAQNFVCSERKSKYIKKKTLKKFLSYWQKSQRFTRKD